jgi:hypothetical protein
MKNIGHKGFSALDIVLGVALLAVIGVASYFAYQNAQPKLSNSTISKVNVSPMPSTSPSPASIVSPTPSPAPMASITPNEGVPIQLVLPAGWNINDSNLISTIDGVQYRIGFQITDSDYLKGNTYAGDAVILDHVTTAHGKDAYIIKAQGNVAISSCAPSNGYGCSMEQSGKPLLILLHPYKPGDQAVETIDFSSASSSQALKAMKLIVESLQL